MLCFAWTKSCCVNNECVMLYALCTQDCYLCLINENKVKS